MKKLTTLLLALCLLLVFPAAAAHAEGDAAGFEWEAYSLEELLEIRDSLSEVITEKQREYAIEHGDRRIVLPGEEATVYVGGDMTVEAIVEKNIDTAPDDTVLVWSSSDETVATVSDKGVVKGLAEGETVIKCMTADNEFIYTEMKVQAVLPVTGVAIEAEENKGLLFEGKDSGMQLNCVISPDNAYCRDLAWTSGNEDIASVDENGYVSFHKAGNVTITVKSLDPFSERAPKEARFALTVLQAMSSVTLDQSSVVMNMNSSLALRATILPDNTSNKALTWESSKPEVATVNNGQVRAISCGTATITCTAADGSGATASCDIEVIQMVTGIRIVDVKQPETLDMNSSKKLKTDIQPEYATNKALEWASSDKSVVTVASDGTIKAVGGGTATITCTAADGSGKTASVNVFVPSISVNKDEYVVKSKDGLSFEVKFYGKSGNFEIMPTSNMYFNVFSSRNGETYTVTISPLRAGRATITLKDKGDPKNNRNITITIDHSAVYDSTSYPAANYSDIMRNPTLHDGNDYSVYGKVLQIMEGSSWGSKYYVARIGTGGYGYYDNVFYVTIYPSALDINIIEDDMVTVYGECTGTYTYTAVRGNSITIPAITADKVIIGRGA